MTKTAGILHGVRPRLWPWLVAGASTLLVVGATPAAYGLRHVVPHGDIAVIDAVVAASVPWVGALLVSRMPRNRVGWVLLAQAFLGLAFASDVWALHSAKVATLPGAEWAAWISEWAWIPFMLLPSLLVLWFPTGAPPGRRWMPLQWLLIALFAADVVLSMLGPSLGHHDMPNPLWAGAPDWVASARDPVTAAIGALGLLGCFPSAFVRWRHSSPVERQQLRWFLVSLPLVPVMFLLPLPYPASDVAGGLGLFGVAAAVAVAVLRHRLYDLDIVVNRTIVYATTTLLIGVVYVGVVSLLNLALAGRTGQLFAAVLVAWLVGPVRSRVQRTVDRLLFGDRATPYVALARLGRRLESPAGPAQLLEAAAADIRLALRVPHVALVAEGLPRVDAGEPNGWTPTLSRELRHREVVLGTLTVSPRHPGDTFAPSEVRLLDDLARQLGTAIHAARATVDLQRSRERLVATREEERRRLHRDLHDGLGPTLGAAVLALDGIHDSLPEDDANRHRIEMVRRELQDAVAEVRRVVYELRPPALDAGLVAALERQVRRLDSAERPPRVVLRSCEQLPELPPAVEVAAYRLASEALANALRHARASTVTVELTMDGGLRLAVSDDGVGLGDAGSDGVGMPSMRERAEELGGRLEVTSDGAGTVLTAYLPVVVS